MMTKENYDMMPPTEVLHKYYDLHEYPEIVKQRIQLWFEMHKKARITASTCFKGIGLGLFWESQEHYEKFIERKECQKVSDEIQLKLDPGISNEIHGIATISSILVPTLLPGCMQVVEAGCSFLHGNIIKNLLEVSCDGYIECQKNCHHRSCNTIAPCGHYKQTIEIKYLTNESNLIHRYHIPIYHTTQMICQMHAEKCIEGWYVLVTEKTVILIANT